MKVFILICPKCKEAKPEQQFVNAKGARRPWCDACRVAYSSRLASLGKAKADAAEANPPPAPSDSVFAALKNQIEENRQLETALWCGYYRGVALSTVGLRRSKAWKMYFQMVNKLQKKES